MKMERTYNVKNKFEKKGQIWRTYTADLYNYSDQ